MQLSTIPNPVESPPRVEAEAVRISSERLDADRPFSRELNEAESRYERDESELEERARASIDDAGTSAPSEEVGDEVTSDQNTEDASGGSTDEEQVDQVGTPVAEGEEALEAESDQAPSGDLAIQLDQPPADTAGGAQEDADPESVEALATVVDPIDTQAGPKQAVSEQVVKQPNLAVGAQKSEGSGTQAVVDRTQSVSSKVIDPASTSVAAVNVDGSATPDSSGEGPGGDLAQQKPGAPVLPTTASNQNVSTETTVRSAIVSTAPPTQATAPGANGATPNLAQTLASTTTPDADADPVNTARLTRGLQSALQQPGGTVTLRLTPPELGTVRIQLQLSSGSVSASFHAEGASARSMLTQQLSQLRTALESQGLNVERLNVQPMQQTSQSSLQQQNQQSTADGRSRGQYTGQQQQPNDDRSDPDQPARESFESLMLNEVA